MTDVAEARLAVGQYTGIYHCDAARRLFAISARSAVADVATRFSSVPYSSSICRQSTAHGRGGTEGGGGTVP